MIYRTVGNRCAFDPSSLKLPITNEEILAILIKLNFRWVSVDLIELACSRIGISHYRRGSRMCEAPEIFDCSSFVKWLYGQRGIWLPRRSIQQRDLGEIIERDDLTSCDLVFVTGHINYYHDDPRDGVGHVGIVTGDGTIIHAASKRVGVIESSMDFFIRKNTFRGARRYLSKEKEIWTLEIPVGRDVETSDDIKWIILQTFAKTKSHNQLQ